MILVTGYSGNTGKIFIEKLLLEFPNKKIIGVSRHKANFDIPNLIEKEVDLKNEGELRDLFSKYQIDTVVHIANILYSKTVMKISTEFSITRVILVHTTGMYSKYRSYSELYLNIEKTISSDYASSNYIILRPTMIYGNSKDYNISKLIRLIDRIPILPIIGRGNSLLQPIFVHDLAEILLRICKEPNFSSGEYIASGGSEISYKDLIHLIAGTLNKKRVFIHIPKAIGLIAVKILNYLFGYKRITVEQINRLSEDKNYSNAKVKEALDFEFTTIENGITYQINEYKTKKQV